MAIVGIDLGTTNSAVAVYRNGEAEIIPNNQNGRTTPSVFQVKPNGEEIVGSQAKMSAASFPNNTVLEVKRLMGSDEKVHIGNNSYRPEEISSKIVRYLKQCAENFLNENVVEAVITVPAYFSDAQRKATKDAGELAGLKIERIINEPTAAALAFSHDNLEKNRLLLVYDLGGGTFDVSIVEIFEGVVEVKTSVGDNKLGGADFDNEIINLIKRNFQQQHGFTMESIASDEKMLYYMLKDLAEQAKINLSAQMETDINIPFVGLKNNMPVSFVMKLRRMDFEQAIKRYVDITIDKVNQSLREANLHVNDISEVLMVGGSTRIPYVQERVRELFPAQIRTDVNPDEVVARGAAVQAGLKAGTVTQEKQMVAIDVCPYTLGTNVGHDNRFDPLIKKNTPIPYRTTRKYYTLNDNQTSMGFPIYQGEEEYCKDNILVSDDFDVHGIPPAPAGKEYIDVVVGYDINGIIELEVLIPSTGQRLRHFVETQVGVMDRQEKANALLRMSEEEERAMLIEHVKQGIYRAEKLKNQVPERDKKRLEVLIERAQHALETGNERQLRAADQQLLDLILKLI